MVSNKHQQRKGKGGKGKEGKEGKGRERMEEPINIHITFPHVNPTVLISNLIIRSHGYTTNLMEFPWFPRSKKIFNGFPWSEPYLRGLRDQTPKMVT